MIDCLFLASNGNFKINIMFCLVSIRPVRSRLYELIDINLLTPRFFDVTTFVHRIFY